MYLKRTPLRLDEYGAYGPSLRGFTDLSAAYRKPEKLALEREEANRRRNRLRELALEQWDRLVGDLEQLIVDQR